MTLLQFVGTLLRAVGEGILGWGALLTLHLASSVFLALLAWMQSQGVKGNEEKENRLESLSIGKRLAVRARDRGERDLRDFVKACVTMVGGAALIFASIYVFGAESWSELIVESARSCKWFPSGLPVMGGLAGAVVMTAGATVFTLSTAKFCAIFLSLSLACQSYIQGTVTAGAEAREAAIRSDGSSEHEHNQNQYPQLGVGTLGKSVVTRAKHSVVSDTQGLCVVVMVLAAGALLLFLGAFLGGDSVQATWSRRVAVYLHN